MFSKLISAVAVALTIKDVSGSACSTGPVLQSSKLRFGNGEGSSVCGGQQLQQPFLWLQQTPSSGEWKKLTYDAKPMEAMISVGGELQETCLGFDSTDESEFIVEDSFGYGTITGTKQCTVGETTLVLTQSFTLAKADSASLTTALTVSATGADAANVEFWWGTGDDYIAGSDWTYKEVGTLGSDGFTAAEQGNAVLVTSGTDDDDNAVGVSFGSPSPGARALHAHCCQFSNIYNLNKDTNFTVGKVFNDGSYGVYLPLGTIKAGEAASASAFYSAAKVTDLKAALQEAASPAEDATTTPEETTDAPTTESSPPPPARPDGTYAQVFKVKAKMEVVDEGSTCADFNEDAAATALATELSKVASTVDPDLVTVTTSCADRRRLDKGLDK